MKNLVIASTKKTPEIIFKASGDLMITGSSLPANFTSFYQPIIEWLEEFKNSSPKKILISFDLEHVNTSSTRIILQILRILNSANNGNSNLTVSWKYDHDDTDMLEQGEALQEIIDRKFDFVIKDQ